MMTRPLPLAPFALALALGCNRTAPSAGPGGVDATAPTTKPTPSAAPTLSTTDLATDLERIAGLYDGGCPTPVAAKAATKENARAVEDDPLIAARVQRAADAIAAGAMRCRADAGAQTTK